MFLRRNRRIVDGETYEYWTLARTARGPRQEIVATPGNEVGGLRVAEEGVAARVEELLAFEQQRRHPMGVIGIDLPGEADEVLHVRAAANGIDPEHKRAAR